MGRRHPELAVMVSLALLTGCAELEEQEESHSETATALSRAIEPPIEVLPDAHLGRSLEALIAAEVAGSNAAHSPTVAECVTHHYEHDGMMVAVHERCAGSHQRLFIYRDLTLWRVFGDADDDDIIDAWFDPQGGGLLLEDENRDTVADRLSESFQRLGLHHPSLDAFPDWEPPAYLDERILEDTDGDGHYDLETITAGVDEQGHPSYWEKR